MCMHSNTLTEYTQGTRILIIIPHTCVLKLLQLSFEYADLSKKDFRVFISMPSRLCLPLFLSVNLQYRDVLV